MRRYQQPVRVEVDQDGRPARFRARGRTYLVLEVLGPHWETQLPWWQPAYAGKSLEELTVRHWRVRALGCGGMRWSSWSTVPAAGLVVGVED